MNVCKFVLKENQKKQSPIRHTTASQLQQMEHSEKQLVCLPANIIYIMHGSFHLQPFYEISIPN